MNEWRNGGKKEDDRIWGWRVEKETHNKIFHSWITPVDSIFGHLEAVASFLLRRDEWMKFLSDWMKKRERNTDREIEVPFLNHRETDRPSFFLPPQLPFYLSVCVSSFTKLKNSLTRRKTPLDKDLMDFLPASSFLHRPHLLSFFSILIHRVQILFVKGKLHPTERKERDSFKGS